MGPAEASRGGQAAGVAEVHTDIDWKAGMNLTVKEVARRTGGGKKVGLAPAHCVFPSMACVVDRGGSRKENGSSGKLPRRSCGSRVLGLPKP
jgi:hypothetical protein